MSLTDLDELVLSCRSDRSKGFISEALVCYRAGAYRAAIVSTYVAVQYDLLDKLRELDLAGDKQARQLLATVEVARRANDTGKTMEVERTLLEMCRDDFELVGPLEYVDLERLRADRNRCAHPSLSDPTEAYQATAELARYHLTSAIDHVLKQQPVQGKAALDRLFAEIGSSYFPTDAKEAEGHFRSGPLLRARDSLVRDFVIGLTKGLLLEMHEPPERARQVAALRAAQALHRERFDLVLRSKLSEIVARCADAEWPNVISFLHSFPETFTLLSFEIAKKAERFIEKCPDHDAATMLSAALDIADLKSAAIRRADSIDVAVFAHLSATYPSLELARVAINRMAASKTYSDVTAWMSKVVVALLPACGVEEIGLILEAAKTNSSFIHNYQREGYLLSVTQNPLAARPEFEQQWRELFSLRERTDASHFFVSFPARLTEMFPSIVEASAPSPEAAT